MQTNPTMQRGELDWLAFCYVSGELNATELAAFEDRLADDQSAREAVASALNLVHTVSAAEHLVELPVVTKPTRRASRWRSVAWLAIAGGVAASVACAMMLANASRNGGPGGNDSMIAVNRETETGATNVFVQPPRGLATAWLETLDQAPYAVEDSTNELTADDRLELDALLLDDDESNVTAPDWMVSALSGMSMSEMNLEGGPQIEREN
jgi:hypothetical protein